MKKAWIILVISALTDFIINVGTGLMTAMVATGKAEVPDSAVLILCLIGGLVQASRTIQQALKATPETSAALTGGTSTVTTNTVEKTP